MSQVGTSQFRNRRRYVHREKSAIVQKFLRKLQWYQGVRIPEQILSHKEKAKTQHNILYPTSIIANSTGDALILDQASARIHIVDRSNVISMRYCWEISRTGTD